MRKERGVKGKPKATKKPALAPKKAAPRKSAPKKRAPKKTVAAKTAKKTTKAAKKTTRTVAARRTTPARAPSRATIPSAKPSERAMQVAAQMPRERALTDEERDAMTKVAQTALRLLTRPSTPFAVVERIGTFVDEVRLGTRPEPKSQDIRLGLGVLWGEQVRETVGWRWVHLSYPDGFASYAIVPDDRAFACFPLNRFSELMRIGSNGVNTSVPLFDSIRSGALPARRKNAYLVIG